MFDHALNVSHQVLTRITDVIIFIWVVWQDYWLFVIPVWRNIPNKDLPDPTQMSKLETNRNWRQSCDGVTAAATLSKLMLWPISTQEWSLYYYIVSIFVSTKQMKNVMNACCRDKHLSPGRQDRIMIVGQGHKAWGRGLEGILQHPRPPRCHCVRLLTQRSFRSQLSKLVQRVESGEPNCHFPRKQDQNQQLSQVNTTNVIA